MKKKFLICTLLVSAMLCVSACDNKPETTETDTVTDKLTETEVQKTEATVEKVSLKITNEKTPLYQVVYSTDLGTDRKAVVKQFVIDMREKTGTTLDIVSDSTEKSSKLKEIIICETARSESKDMSGLCYGDYGIEVLNDGTVLAYGYGGITLQKALQSILNATEKAQDGSYYYKGLSRIESEYSKILDQLPKADFGNVDSMYESATNVYQISINGAKAIDFNSYKSVLVQKGYTLHSENSIDSQNYFSTYKNDKYAIHIGYHGNTSTIELLIEKLGYLPAASAPTYTKKVDTTVTQMKLPQNYGMLYVVQLEDGTFVVIDGGMSDSETQNELIAYLEKNNEGTGYAKPQVTWMFTHSHIDHIGLATSFISSYSSRFDLNLVCTNFINLKSDYASTFTDGYEPSSLMNTIKTKFPNAQIFNFHTGQKLRLAGCDITFYITHEDIYPVKLGTLNSASAVWKMDFGSKSFMVLGDTTETGAEILNTYYGSSLKSTVMQAAHHGTTASSGTKNIINLYKYINPTVVMWANSDPAAVRNFSANDGLLSKSGLISVYSNQTKSYLMG